MLNAELFVSLLIAIIYAMCNFIVKTLDSLWGGHLARPLWTGETPIPQDY